MPKYLNTLGNSSIAIAICDRCKMKRPITQLGPDPNSPGLRVCKGVENGCQDKFDPWRLPARQPEKIALRQPRPDDSLTGTAARPPNLPPDGA